MQTHEGGRFVLACDATGCTERYTAPEGATQQDAYALSGGEGWEHVGADSRCPDHTSWMTRHGRRADETPVDKTHADEADHEADLKAPVESISEPVEAISEADLTRRAGESLEATPDHTPVQTGAGAVGVSEADKAAAPPKADDAADPVKAATHEGPEASTQSA